MAGQSIAKLAILLTTDTKGMETGFARGEGMIRRFDSTAKSASLNTGRLSNAFTALSARAAGLSNLGSLATAFGPAGLAAAGALAVGKLALSLGKAADAAQQVKLKGDALKATWSGQFAELSKQSGILKNAFVETFGGIVAKDMAGFTSMLAVMVKGFNDLIGVSSVAQQRFTALTAGAAKLKDLQTREAELREKSKATGGRLSGADLDEHRAVVSAIDKIIQGDWLAGFNAKIGDSLNDFGNKMQARADAIKRSIETPEDAFRRSRQELQDLHQGGFLTRDQFNQALRKEEQELKRANDLNAKQLEVMQRIESKPVLQFRYGRL